MITFKGYTPYLKKVVCFGLDSVPIAVSETQIALSRQQPSKIVDTNSLVRVFNEFRAVEGDKVYEDGILIGNLVYANGLFIHESGKLIKKYDSCKHKLVGEEDIKIIREICKFEERTPILFKDNKAYFGFMSILSLVGKSTIRTYNGNEIELSDVRDILYIDENLKLAVGDVSKDGLWKVSLVEKDFNILPVIIHESGEIRELEQNLNLFK